REAVAFQTDNAALRQVVRAREQRVNQFAGDVKDLQAESEKQIGRLEEQVRDQVQAAAKARREAMAFQTENARLGQAVRAGEQRVNQLERDATGLRTKLAKREKDRDDLQRKLQNQEARVNRVWNRLRAVAESVREQVRVPFAARAAALVID